MWLVKLNKTLAASVLCAATAAPWQALHACEGEDYQRTVSILNYAMEAAFRFGQTMDFDRYVRETQQIAAAVEELPYSCQAMLQQLNPGPGPDGGGGGTTCSGGVCCDDSGCYQ